MIPMLARLARDQAAPPRALSLVVVLIDEGLLAPQWQRVKEYGVARLIGTSRQYAGQILAWLAHAGYLERRDEPFVGRLYRIKGDS